MEDDLFPMPTPILLGRQFIKTARININMYNGTLTIEFDREVICLDIFDAIRYSSDLNSCFLADIIDSLVQQIF